MNSLQYANDLLARRAKRSAVAAHQDFLSPEARYLQERKQALMFKKTAAEQAQQELKQFHLDRISTAISASFAEDYDECFASRPPIFKRRYGGTIVAQLSDLHFGALVTDPNIGRFNVKYASRRLRAYARNILELQALYRATDLVVALTGDIIDSCWGKMLLEKIMQSDGPQLQAATSAFKVICSFIEELATVGCFQGVAVRGVAGNEARLSPENSQGEKTKPDNLDCMVNALINTHFENTNTAVDCQFGLYDQVIEVEGQRILLIHGDTFKGQNLDQKQIEKALADHQCDFGMSGHVHYPMTTGNWSRSGCLVGPDAYATHSLRYKLGRAQQTCYYLRGPDVRNTHIIDLTHPDDDVQGYVITSDKGAFGYQAEDN